MDAAIAAAPWIAVGYLALLAVGAVIHQRRPRVRAGRRARPGP